MSLIHWEPFEGLESWFSRPKRQVRSRFPSLLEGEAGEWVPTTDIRESGKEFLIKAELPEVGKHDVHVSVKDGSLIIEGERKTEKEDKGGTYHRRECFYGNFYRRFALPDNVDESQIRAERKDGVLNIHLPKSEEKPKSQTLEVKIE